MGGGLWPRTVSLPAALSDLKMNIMNGEVWLSGEGGVLVPEAGQAEWGGEGRGGSTPVVGVGWGWLSVVTRAEKCTTPCSYPQSSACTHNPFVVFACDNMQIEEFGVT